MSGINATSPVGLPNWRPNAAGATGQSQSDPKVDFGKVVHNAINQMDKHQKASEVAIQHLLTGKSQDILPVVAAVAKADLSFKLLMGVRNKVIEAYKQTMNMQI